MMDTPVIFETEYLQEFQDLFGQYRGIVYCLMYQIYLDGGWKAMERLLPRTTAWRIRSALIDADYLAPEGFAKCRECGKLFEKEGRRVFHEERCRSRYHARKSMRKRRSMAVQIER